jgi:asparagine synthetase B (glutamine-hydrolysing)
VCGGIFAAKDFDPLRHRGVDTLYPYLHPDVLGPSLGLPWSTRCTGGQSKGLLKRALARHVPPELVYRKKSGFRPREHRAFSEADMQAFIRERALRRDSPLAEFLNLARIEWLFSRAYGTKPIHFKAYNLLWVLAFAGGWIDGLRGLRDASGGS